MAHCLFKIIERDGRPFAWCAACQHGYPTLQLDPARHFRTCRTGRGESKAKIAECVHRGAKAIRWEPCASCCGTVRLAVLACAVHGECTVGKQIAGVKCCAKCKDIKATPG